MRAFNAVDPGSFVKTPCLCADVCVQLEPGEVGLGEVGGDNAVSFSPLVEDEQCCHQMPQIPLLIGCSFPRFDFRSKLCSGHDDSGFPAQYKANPDVEVAESSALFNDGDRFIHVVLIRHDPSVVFPFCGNLHLDGLVGYLSIITRFSSRLTRRPPRRTTSGVAAGARAWWNTRLRHRLGLWGNVCFP